MPSGTKYVYRGKPDGFLATTGNTESTRPLTTPFYEALVVDVVLDQFHPNYSPDGYNVGTIKVRLLSVDNSRDDDLLDWADPLETTIQEMPLIGELVLVQKVLGNFFYLRKVNLTRILQEHGMLNLNNQLNNRPTQLKSQITSQTQEIDVNTHKFGQYFKPDSRIRQLKHFEGDVIFQGRMGHSIRFGSSQIDPSSKGMAPNLILRTGQAKDIETSNSSVDGIYGLILEDINKDASSIWMTSDQVVPFEPTTISAGSFSRSVKNPPQKYDGAQIILNSDRLLLNAKTTHIMLFANQEIHLNSFKDTSIDTDSSISLTANIDIIQMASRNIDNIADVDFTVTSGRDITLISKTKSSVLSQKIFLGSIKNDEEPMVGGASLSKWLARLILVFMGNPPQILPWTTQKGTSVPPPAPSIAATQHVITPVGPGVLSPNIVKGLTQLYNELLKNNSGQQSSANFAGAPFNSQDNFLTLANEDVKVELNEFKQGSQTISENNKWLLTDPYYKVTVT